MTEKTMLIFDCPQCGQGMQTDESSSGKDARCPYCRETITVPIKVTSPRGSIIKPPMPQRAPNPPPMQPQPVPSISTVKKTSGLAVAGMILGILSIIPGTFMGGTIFAILGLVFSSVSLYRISRKPDELEGNGLAIAGLTTSIVGLLVSILLLTIYSAFAAAVAGVISGIVQAMPK